MQYNILHKPTYSALDVQLQPGENIVAEAGAMSWMDSTIETKTSTRGGVLGGLKRSVLGGESFFQNTYSATTEPANVCLVPGSPGDIVAYEMDGELLMQKGAYLASTDGIKCDSKWDGFRGFFNVGLFLLRTVGTGTLFFGSYGAVQEITVNGSYTIDNGYAVAWEPSLQYRLTKAAKIRSFLFSDQIVLEFSGQGKVWVQSRSPYGFANWAHRYRPTKNN